MKSSKKIEITLDPSKLTIPPQININTSFTEIKDILDASEAERRSIMSQQIPNLNIIKSNDAVLTKLIESSMTPSEKILSKYPQIFQTLNLQKELRPQDFQYENPYQNKK